MTNSGQNHSVVNGFALSAVFWLVVGLVVGLWLAVEMFSPSFNLTPWLSFGRLRVVHTNGLIYGFALAGMFACSYYSSRSPSRSRGIFTRSSRQFSCRPARSSSSEIPCG
jgi:cytochrome c oxidase cbb3-type subunit 1